MRLQTLFLTGFSFFLKKAPVIFSEHGHRRIAGIFTSLLNTRLSSHLLLRTLLHAIFVGTPGPWRLCFETISQVRREGTTLARMAGVLGSQAFGKLETHVGQKRHS